VAILTRDGLLAASDLKEKDVDLPTIGGSVRIRSLPAEYSNAAVSQAIRVTQTPKGDQITLMDNGKLELLQVLHGLIDPKLSNLAEVQTFAKNCGPAFKTLVQAIVELSDLSDEAAEMTAATFPSGGGRETGPGEDATPNGGSGPAVHARTGA
jgi:hypothetical protein